MGRWTGVVCVSGRLRRERAVGGIATVTADAGRPGKPTTSRRQSSDSRGSGGRAARGAGTGAPRRVHRKKLRIGGRNGTGVAMRSPREAPPCRQRQLPDSVGIGSEKNRFLWATPSAWRAGNGGAGFGRDRPWAGTVIWRRGIDTSITGVPSSEEDRKMAEIVLRGTDHGHQLGFVQTENPPRDRQAADRSRAGSRPAG